MSYVNTAVSNDSDLRLPARHSGVSRVGAHLSTTGEIENVVRRFVEQVHDHPSAESPIAPELRLGSLEDRFRAVKERRELQSSRLNDLNQRFDELASMRNGSDKLAPVESLTRYIDIHERTRRWVTEAKNFLAEREASISIVTEHHRTLLESFGCSELDELQDLRRYTEQRVTERRGRFCGLGTLVYRNEIGALEEKLAAFRAIESELTEPLVAAEYQLRFHGETLDERGPEIESRFLTAAERVIRGERYAIAETARAEERAELPATILAALRSDEINGIALAMALRGQIFFSGQAPKADESLIAEVRGILEDGLRLAQEDGFGRLNGEGGAWQAIKERIQDLPFDLQYSVERALQEDLPQAERSWRTTWRWIERHPILADIRSIDEAHHRINELLKELPSSTIDDRREFAGALGIDIRVHREGERDRGDTLVSGFNPKVFEQILSHPLVQRSLGDEFTQSARAVLRTEIIERFKNAIAEEKETRIQIGRMMMQLPVLETAPLVLLYAFREPGHSGESPFRGNGGGVNDISTYLKNLSAADRAQLRSMAIPGFLEAIGIIETHQRSYAHHRIQNHEGEFVENPRYVELQGHLLTMTEHLLRTGDPATQRFMAWVMSGIDAPFTEHFRETVVKAIATRNESGVDSACFHGVLDRLRHHRDLESAVAVLAGVDARPELRASLSKEHGYHLLSAMTASTLSSSDCETIGASTEHSSESVALVHRFIRELRHSASFDLHFKLRGETLQETFPAYAEAAKIPGVLDALGALSRYRYVFRPEHLEVLPTLVEVYPNILRGMAQIQKYNPDFRYEPVVFGDRALGRERFAIDPYAGLLMRYGAESQITVLQKAYTSPGGIDPLLVRAAYGAWRARDTAMIPTFGTVEDVPVFFPTVLERVVRHAGEIESGKISPYGALVAHSMGTRLLSRSPAWAEALLNVTERLERDAGSDHDRARDRLYLVLDTLRVVMSDAAEPPQGFIRWCEYIARSADGVAVGPLYTHVGREIFNNGSLRNDLVNVFVHYHRFFSDTTTLERLMMLLGNDPRDFSRIVPALIETQAIELDSTSFLRLVDTLHASARRLGASSETVFRGALPVLRASGWLSSVEDLIAVLPKLEGLAAQGLASDDSWKTLAALYNPRAANPLLGEEYIGEPARELDIFTEYIKGHGNIALPILYGAFHRCIGNRPFTDQEQKTYGLRSTGKAGLMELRERSNTVRRRILASDGPIDTASPLESEIIAVQSRFNESEWVRSDQTLGGRIQSFNAAWRSGEILPLSAAFAGCSGETFRVRRIDERALERFEYTADALHKLEQLRRDVMTVHRRSLEEVFRAELQVLAAGVSERITDLSRPLSEAERLKDATGRRAAARVEEATRWLEFQSALPEINNLVGLVKAVAAFERKDDPVTTPVLRRCLTRLGLEQIGGGDELRAAADSPTNRETIARFVEFYGGIVPIDVMQELELTERQQKRAGSAVHVKALTVELERIAGLATAGTEVIGLRPTRGILGELSGFVCDACWTKDTDILRRYPHLTTVVFVRNPGTADERLCGATLVLKVRSEATDTSPAEDVFVIRGFNPLQNTITQLKADEFFEGFLGWLQGVARAEGVSKIVIPGGVAGGSQTNRPTIHTYVAERYGSAPIVPLSSELKSTFNDYDISRTCHLVWDALGAPVGREQELVETVPDTSIPSLT